MQRIVVGLALSATTITMSLAAQAMPGVSISKSAPSFRARDQFGKEQTIKSLMGPNGLVLVFFRSADW